MSRATKTRTKAGSTESSDVTGIALVASAFGHILQASKNAELQKDQKTLLTFLRNLQAGYARLADRNATLKKAYEALEDVNRTLRRQIAELEREKTDLETRYLTLMRKYESSPAPTEAP